MRLKLAMSRRWVQGLAMGLVFGVLFAVFRGLQDGRWVYAVVVGAVSGVFFGVVMSVVMGRLTGRLLAGVEDLPEQERRVVVRAASGGPVPTDPRLREAARVFAVARQEELQRTWRRSVVIFSVFVAFYVVLALTEEWWWWLAVLLFLGFLGMSLTAPSRLRRRVAALTPGP